MTHNTQSGRDFEQLDALSIKKNAGKLDIYVDGVSGSDLFPGTEAKPVETLTRAYELVPSWVTDRVIIHLAPHAGTGYVLPSMRKILQANVWVVSEDTTELLAATATGGSTTRADTTGLSIDEYRGKTIEILTGAAAGDRRTIRDNTVTQIRPVYQFSGAVAASDSFRVFEPVTRVTATAELIVAHGLGGQTTAPFLVGGKIPGLYFENLILDTADDIHGSDSSVHFYGCEFIENVLALLGPTSWAAGYEKSLTDTSPFATVEERGALASTSWYGWGIHHTDTPVLFAIVVGRFIGFIVGQQLSFFGGHHQIMGGSFRGGPTAAGIVNNAGGGNGPSTLILQAGTAALDILIDATEAPAVRCFGDNAFIKLDEVTITTTTSGHGISVQRNGQVDIDDVNITSAEVGLKAETGGVIRFNTGIVITATGNDTEVGEVPATGTLASYGAAGAFLVEATSDGSIIQRNI